MASALTPRCAHADRTSLAIADCAWPAGTVVTWYLDPSAQFNGLTHDQAADAIAAGIAPWPRACGVQVARVDRPELARVLAGTRPIDSLDGILAETELPCDGRSDVQHTMAFDSAEVWTVGKLRKVTMHEFGHGLGLGHSPAGILAVMGPYYDAALEDLQAWDVEQAQERYGASATPQADEPASVTLAPILVTFEVDQPGRYTMEVTASFTFTEPKRT